MEELYKTINDLVARVSYLENENNNLKAELNKVSLMAKISCPILSNDERQQAALDYSAIVDEEKIVDDLKVSFK